MAPLGFLVIGRPRISIANFLSYLNLVEIFPPDIVISLANISSIFCRYSFASNKDTTI